MLTMGVPWGWGSMNVSKNMASYEYDGGRGEQHLPGARAPPRSPRRPARGARSGARGLGPGGCCSPRHRVQFHSRDEGSKCVG